MGTSRYVYNLLVSDFKNSNVRYNPNMLTSLYNGTFVLFEFYNTLNFNSLRDSYVTKKNNTRLESWETFTPKEIRAYSVKEFVQAYTENVDRKNHGILKSFKMTKKYKRDRKDTITIQKESIKFVDKKYISIYPKSLEKIRFRDKKVMNTIISATKITHDHDRWYMNYVYEADSNIDIDKEVIALDPGVRKFMVGYDLEGNILTSVLPRIRIKRLQKRLDSLISKMSQKRMSTSRRRYKQARQHDRIQHKTSGLIDDLHYKTICSLKSYRTIFLPTFETQKMVGSRSVLKRSVKREILGLRHYNFKLRLRNSIQVVGGNVVDCNESYTSKTCGRCGFLNKSSSSETFNCTV